MLAPVLARLLSLWEFRIVQADPPPLPPGQQCWPTASSLTVHPPAGTPGRTSPQYATNNPFLQVMWLSWGRGLMVVAVLYRYSRQTDRREYYYSRSRSADQRAMVDRPVYTRSRSTDRADSAHPGCRRSAPPSPSLTR